MYYPYLRARQFELIALRELCAEEAIQGTVTAVLEPVKESISNLNLANKVMVDHKAKAYLILNPFVGEMHGDTVYFCEYLRMLDQCAYLPAFHYTNNAKYIEQMVAKFNLQECMIICYSNYTDDAILRTLCARDFVSHIMVFEPQKNRSLDRHLHVLGKNYIRLDDEFEKQEKNADFLNIAAHKFTEEHLFYTQDSYQGFSDFTVLPSEYSEGGSTPRAVAIHLTYVNDEEENQIWIRHFTSETNDSIANVQGKFEEAAQKALEFCTQKKLDNSAILELRSYYDEGRYPGLGTVKKISIKNHLLVVSSFLS